MHLSFISSFYIFVYLIKKCAQSVDFIYVQYVAEKERK